MATLMNSASANDVISEIIRKVAKPEAGEEVYMYAGILVCLAVLYIVYTQLTKAKPDFVDQLTMADVVTGKGSAKQEFTEEDKLYQELDKLVGIDKELNGSLSQESFFKVRNAINKHAQIEFRPKKEELMTQRLVHFQNGDWQNYAKMVGTAAQAYNQLLIQRTKQAIEHLDLTEQNYVLTQQQVQRDPSMGQRIAEHDLNLAKTLESKEVTESKEEIKRIWMEKVRLEGELVMKLQGVQARSPQEAQSLALIERTKVLDTIYVKYGTKFNYLMNAIEFHGLKDDNDIKTLELSFTMKHEQKQQEQMKSMELGAEDKAIVDEELKGIEQVTPNSSGMIALDTYINLQKIITKLSWKLRSATEPQHVIARRELLKENKEADYKKCVAERQNELRGKVVGFTIHTLRSLGVNEQMWQASAQHYAQNPQTKMKVDLEIQMLMKGFETETTVDLTKELLSRDDTMKYIKVMEEKKMDSIAKLQQLSKQQPLNQMQAQMIMEMEKIQGFDELWLQYGVGEEEIARGFRENNIQTDPEFTEYAQQMQQKMMQRQAGGQ